MGMSASQVRLLTITKRIHTVENEAERIQNQKMLLGLQSDEAYEEYLAAMEKKNIEYAFFDGEQGNFDWDKLNIAKLFNQGYQLKVRVPGLVDHDTMTKTVTVNVNHDFNPDNTVTKSGVAPQLEAQIVNNETVYIPSQNEDGTISIKQGNNVVANISADDAEDFIAYYAAHPSDDPDGFACQVTVGENVYNAVYYPAVTAQDPVYENGILITPAVEAQEPKLEINQPVYEITSNEVDEDGHPLDFSDLGISSLDTPLYYDYQNAITCTMTIGTGDTAHQVTGTYNPVTKQLTYQETLDVTEADEWLVCTNTDEVMDALTLISQRHYGSEFTTEDLSANALTDPAVLRELVYNAYAIIQAQIYDEDTGRHEWKDTSVATNVGLRERTDDEQLAKAEAEYEAALRRIDRKEQQYDKELAKFDQERKALTTQLDTLKTCIKENIDRTFKIFQG